MGAATIVLACVVLAGWALDSRAMTGIIRSLPAMKAGTAVALAAGGAALICLRDGATPQARRLGRALGLAVALLGAIVCLEYLFGSFGIDELLVHDPATTYPGRPAPHTAVALVAIGAALATVDGRSRCARRAQRLLLGASVVIVLFALVGYAFAVDYLRGVSSGTGVAVNTLAALVLLVAGLLCLRVDRGLAAALRGGGTGARMARVLLPVVSLAVFVVGAITSGLVVHGIVGPRVAISAFTLAMILGLSAVLLVTAARMRAADDDVGRLAAIVEASRDAIVGIDAEGRVTSWNAGALVLFGHPPDAVVGRDHGVLVPPGLRPLMLEHLDRARAGRPVVDWPARVLTRDGRSIDVEVTISALAEEGHVFAGAVALVIRDLAERKEAEHRFASLLEAAPDGMVIVAEDGDIVLVNRQMEQLFGYPREELMGQPIERLVPERLRAVHRGHRQHFAGDGHPRAMGTDLDISLVRRDGTEVPVAVSLSPLETDQGRLVIAAVRDVSERRRSQRELAESEERFRRSFEDSAVGMALLTADDHVGDRLLEVNDALVAITGYSADELRGHGLPVIIHKDDLPSLDHDLEGLLTGETAVLRREVRLSGASGEVLWASLTVSLVRDAAGSPVHAVLQLQDVSERIRFEEELRHLADHDPLTGLLNRRRFEQELARELATAQRYGDRGAVVVMDLDDFKLVNDSLGHAAGDELIRVVSNALRERLRGTDVLGRMGGDEFAAVLPRVGEREALRIARMLLAAVRDAAHASVVRTERRVTASIGVAVFGPGDAVSAEDALARADIAMYDAKEAGRDRVASYDPEAPRHRGMRTRLAWAERVEAALEQDRFVLHAQPIRAVAGPAEERCELLLRMVGDDGELIGPATFLPVAEASGLAQRIDLWVVGHAIELLRDPEVLGGNATFEVNLSATTINDPSMLDLLSTLVSTSGVDPARLTFEITETAAIVSMGRAVAFADRLRAIGCEFALDDFGTGFASFTYLKHLGFDYVKIDGEFIEDLPSSRVNQLIVRSIVELARGLGKKTVAEYVTDAATEQLVTDLGVDYVQGFHIGRPVPVALAVARR